jgi:L-serine kinase (ATP) / ParB family transcriptional regulator, heme-responsive regulator
MIRHYEKLIHQGELPRLAMVEQDRLLFHEEIEPARVGRIASRLAEEGRLRHPAIAGTCSKSGEILLVDGAHRVSALRQLGYPFAAVQVIAYDDPLVELTTWHHLLRLTDLGRFLDFAQALPGLRLRRRPASEGRGPIYRFPGQLFQIVLKDRSALHAVMVRPLSLSSQAEILRKLVGWYKTDGLLDRISYDEFDWLGVNYPEFSALVVFRPWTKDEIRRLARSRQCLPAGVTRHLVTKRVLRLNLPLELMRGDATVEQRNDSLAALVLERVRQGRIRFYTESSFSFDE